MGVRVDQSFVEFVDAHSTQLLRVAILLTGDRGHAEDLLQSALLRAAARWDRAREAPLPYVRTVLVNLARDDRRRWRRRPRELPLTDAEIAGTAADPALDRVTDRGVVVRALAALPLRQRQVIVLRYFEDLSVEQTAAVLGASTGTVKSYTSRALSRLRELLAATTDPLTEVHRG